MTACESSGYTGASFLYHKSVTLYTVLRKEGLSSLSVISSFKPMSIFISSPRQQMLLLAFFSEGLTGPQKAPSPSFFSLLR